MSKSIRVNDFHWEPGKNDAEYIKLLESSRDEWGRIAQKAISKLKTLSKAQEPVKYSTRKGVNGFSFVWTCGHCGKDLQPNNRAASYCSYCGKKVKWDD